MQIAGLVKTSTIDYPGLLAAVLFAPGCNYDCGFCHNRRLLSSPDLLTDSEVWNFLRRRAGLLDGIVISGGEPTLQKELFEFAKKLKALGYKIKLDTNGSNPTVIEKLLMENLLDYAAIDYKAPFEKYERICGANAGGIQKSIRLLEKSGVQYEMRTTVIPELDIDDLLIMAQQAPVLPKYVLQLYRRVGEEGTAAIYTPPDIESFLSKILPYQPNAMARC